MCFFQGMTFEMFTSEPRLKGDYYQPGETDEQYRKRQFARRQEQRERNIAANARRTSKVINFATKNSRKVAD